ncbi:phage repressor protein [Halobellus sp. Atlit-38R]|uniref:phage repressor protein n=1 Tax=Halobellus sp. Atlit-38R TaxID=2282131 RepID=UPI000EF24058|nr:phage repressor protein [Halobellus sp. Atlit-38R]RLM89580.1 phage repressor protein [Halobellus sp. Atlit-38R]
MRHSGDWMALVDDRVLEYLREQGSGSPTEMKREGPIHYSRQYIDKRCKKLAEEGLVEHLGNGIYVITEDGEAYLDGKLDTQNWVRIDENGGAATAGTHAPTEDENGQES